MLKTKMLKTKKYWLHTLFAACFIVLFLAEFYAINCIEPIRIAFSNATGVNIAYTPFKYLWGGWLLGLFVYSPIGGALMYSLEE